MSNIYTRRKYWIRVGSGAIVLLFVGIGVFAWLSFYASATAFQDNRRYIFLSSTVKNKKNQLLYQLDTGGMLKSLHAFEWFANKARLWGRLRPGRYEITRGMSVDEIVKRLKMGVQALENVTLRKVRTVEQFAASVAQHFEQDSAAFVRVFTSDSILAKYHLNTYTFFTTVILNTYQMYWTTTPQQFLRRCVVEAGRFWNESRRTAAKKLGLSVEEVYTLASIVEEESNKNDEKPRVASVYLNRLRRGIRLEADPTARYCTRDFQIRRVLLKHLRVDCPHNTYLHTGLPPGPICTPSIASIDAVLGAEKTDYLYFCARPQRDGYHNFATTHREHLRNAREFHRQLNRERVFR